jgi:hypothetical protein
MKGEGLQFKGEYKNEQMTAYFTVKNVESSF